MNKDQKNPKEGGFEHAKISPTAKMVSYMRMFTDIPFSRELAEASGSEAVFNALGMKELELRPMIPMIEARYKHVTEIIRESGITRVIELATGMSSRGLELTEDSNFEYVETDLPGILEEKKEITTKDLASRDTKRPNLHFAPVNATSREELEGARSLLSPGPVVIVNEGLLMYLDTDEKRMVAENVLAILKESQGIWVTNDITAKDARERLLKNAKIDPEVLKRIMGSILGATNRDVMSNTFETEESAEDFFRKIGFKIEKRPQTEVFNQLSSVDPNIFPVETVKAMLEERLTWILKVA